MFFGYVSKRIRVTESQNLVKMQALSEKSIWFIFRNLFININLIKNKKEILSAYKVLIFLSLRILTIEKTLRSIQ